MVLGIFLLTAMVPTMIGVNEASKDTRDHEERRRATARQQRTHLSVQCMSYDILPQQRQEIHNAHVYLCADRKVSSSFQFIGTYALCLSAIRNRVWLLLTTV